MTTALTASQIDFLNRFAHNLAPLGDKIAELDTAFGAISSQAAPVNAVNATKALTIDGVVIDGETVTINNPLIANTDVYEFLTDAAQTKTSVTNIAVDITPHVGYATGTLTLPTIPVAGDTMTIGDVVYNFIANNATQGSGKIRIGANVAGAKVNIVAAINGTDTYNTPNPWVSASDFAGDVCTLTALVGGVIGNSIVTTEVITPADGVFGAGTLGSGTDCSAANAITHLVAAIEANDSQGVAAVDSTGGVVTLTADVAGVSGNDIAVSETMLHGAFAGAATKLSGGVDGTVGLLHELRSDSSYIYVCTAPNTVAGKNWRRLSIGSAY